MSNTIYIVNQKIAVRAWWTRPKDQIIWCKITKIYDSEYIEIKPETGNTHIRFINANRIIN